MAAARYVLLPIFLLAEGAFSQCFTRTNCTGDIVPAANQRVCCAGTDEGLSYNDVDTCSLCIGMSEVESEGVCCS